jgi:TPR repeat protein
MRRLRILAATLAAIAVVTLSENEAAAQPAASNDNTDRSAPQPPSITLVLPKPTTVETLVGVAESGNVDAMNLLGVLYTTGTQVPRDTTMALYWFQKAIDGGSADAMCNLATMYLVGIGLSRDPVNALRWFARSAARGNVRASYSVAVMAEKGLGTGRNLPLARAMYRRAAESGFTPAMVRISEDYARGWGTRRDLVEAYAWLQVALQSGLPEELQIAAFASMNELEARLAPERRDQARERATGIIALVKKRAFPAGPKAPAAMHLSSL